MVKIAENSRIVRLQLTCLTPPPVPACTEEAEFGVQDRQEVVHPGQLQADGSLRYEIEVVAARQDETVEVRWRGAYVHGKSSAPFLYLSQRSLSAQRVGWIRRLKVPLPRLTWEQVAARQTPPCFAATIAGSGSGTTPLLGAGWSLQE